MNTFEKIAFVTCMFLSVAFFLSIFVADTLTMKWACLLMCGVYVYIAWMIKTKTLEGRK